MLGGSRSRPGGEFERSAAVATGNRRPNTITRLVEDVDDDERLVAMQAKARKQNP